MPDAGNGSGGGADGRKRRAALPKRFYKHAGTKKERAGVLLVLDDKPVRTPRNALLVLPNAALAEAVAQEWQAQGDRIDPETMPLTKLANSVLDGALGREAALVENILGYAGSDLLCYRADAPEPLVALQRLHWDPVIGWAGQALSAAMRVAPGIVHVGQAETSLTSIERRLAAFDAWSLAALQVMAGLTGSALLALGVALGRLSPEAAWAAAHVDEDWQISQWGEDDEARLRREKHWRDFAAAARFGQLLGAFTPTKS